MTEIDAHCGKQGKWEQERHPPHSPPRNGGCGTSSLWGCLSGRGVSNRSHPRQTGGCGLLTGRPGKDGSWDQASARPVELGGHPLVPEAPHPVTGVCCVCDVSVHADWSAEQSCPRRGGRAGASGPRAPQLRSRPRLWLFAPRSWSWRKTRPATRAGATASAVLLRLPGSGQATCHLHRQSQEESECNTHAWGSTQACWGHGNRKGTRQHGVQEATGQGRSRS